MFSVTVKSNEGTKQAEYDAPVLASELLKSLGISVPMPCGGKGTCGKCTVLLNGETVQACKTWIKADAVLDCRNREMQVLGITGGEMPDFLKNPLVSSGYGAAIDIGTTTIACYIYKFPECTLVKERCVPNPQGAFGADVISRMEFSMNGGAKALKEALFDAIKALTEGFAIGAYVFCGNTAMLYFLTGQNPESFAMAPYVADDLFGRFEKNAYLVRAASAFCGGDITAAVLASGMLGDRTSLLLDIGTNGEMVLKHEDALFCTSAAAGPCFEGAGITCGMMATEGAISSVFLVGNEICYKTIGGAAPLGLCGTGLVDAVSTLLQKGIIDKTGYMEEPYYFDATDVLLTPEDVRAYQLAKSAICAGVETLLYTADVTFDEIDRVYIAGGFGSFLHIESAAKTGLIPKELAEKAVAIGNAAGMGASMILQSREKLEESERIMEHAKILNLAESSYFTERYIKNMMFD